MRVFTTIDLSRAGNDCYIYDYYSLVEIAYHKYVLRTTTYSRSIDPPDVKIYTLSEIEPVILEQLNRWAG